jgi:hypothetical protein
VGEAQLTCVFVLLAERRVSYRWLVTEPQPIDYEALRKRFPWVGLARTEEDNISSRYREIMAQARVDREVIEAIDAVRRSA